MMVFPPSVRCRLAGLASLAAVVAGAAPAAGQPVRPSAVVFLAPRDRAEVTRKALLALRGHLAGDPVRLAVEWIDALPPDLVLQMRLARELASTHGAAAVCWTLPGLPARVYLFVPVPLPGQVFRRVVSDAGITGDAGRAEAEAIILRESIRSLLRGEEVGEAVPLPSERVARARPTRRARVVPIAPPVTAPRPVPARRAWARLAAAYQVAGYATEAPASHGLWLDLSVDPHPSWSVFAAFLVLPPVRVTGALAELTVERYPMTLGVRYRWQRGRVELGVSLGLTLDPVRYRPRALEEELVVLGDGRDYVVSIDLMALGHVRLVWRLRAFVGIGLQVPVNARRYLAQSEEATERLLAPWPARPQALLGLAVDLY